MSIKCLAMGRETLVRIRHHSHKRTWSVLLSLWSVFSSSMERRAVWLPSYTFFTNFVISRRQHPLPTVCPPHKTPLAVYPKFCASHKMRHIVNITRSQITASQCYFAFPNNLSIGGYPDVMPRRATIVVRVKLLILYQNSAVQRIFSIITVDQGAERSLINIIRADDRKSAGTTITD